MAIGNALEIHGDDDDDVLQVSDTSKHDYSTCNFGKVGVAIICRKPEPE